MHFLMVFDFTQLWLDGRPGNEYFWIYHKISGLLKPQTPLGVHPQWFETTVWNRYEWFLLLCMKHQTHFENQPWHAMLCCQKAGHTDNIEHDYYYNLCVQTRRRETNGLWKSCSIAYTQWAKIISIGAFQSIWKDSSRIWTSNNFWPLYLSCPTIFTL